jgi:hypothetical protein
MLWLALIPLTWALGVLFVILCLTETRARGTRPFRGTPGTSAAGYGRSAGYARAAA